MGVISLGLSEVQVGQIAADGGEATSYDKIGKTYQNTCKMVQEKADVTEHYEEGQSAPEVRKKKKKSADPHILHHGPRPHVPQSLHGR